MTSSHPSSPPWRVLLADDHPVLREGVATLVEAAPDMDIVAQACGGREAVQLAERQRPDVAVIDISMPDLNGAEATEQIRARCPTVMVLALTRHSDEGHLRRMFKAGATGYLIKRAAGEELIDAIRTVGQGGTYVDPELAGPMALRRASKPAADAIAGWVRPALSEREEQVLRMVAWGQSNKEVAAQLGLSVKTVEFYRAGATAKLKLRSRTDILRFALAQRWLTRD